jgi:hypothetical protein
MDDNAVVGALSGCSDRRRRIDRRDSLKRGSISAISFNPPKRLGDSLSVDGLPAKRIEIATNGVVCRRCPTVYLDDL